MTDNTRGLTKSKWEESLNVVTEKLNSLKVGTLMVQIKSKMADPLLNQLKLD